jgi:hypothetical protein
VRGFVPAAVGPVVAGAVSAAALRLDRSERAGRSGHDSDLRAGYLRAGAVEICDWHRQLTEDYWGAPEFGPVFGPGGDSGMFFDGPL